MSSLEFSEGQLSYVLNLVTINVKLNGVALEAILNEDIASRDGNETGGAIPTEG
jgi:hypothetical protein